MLELVGRVALQLTCLLWGQEISYLGLVMLGISTPLKINETVAYHANKSSLSETSKEILTATFFAVYNRLNLSST